MSDHPVLKKLKHPAGVHKQSGDLSVKLLVGLFVSAFLFSGCLTLLFLAMRGVLALGGMVASGGPYAIEYPAPGWVWLFPVAIIVGAASVFAHENFRHDAGGLSLLALAWPALFLSLGYNFLEFAFRQPGGGYRIVWGWLVCGLLFVIMGAGPMLLARSKKSRSVREGKPVPSPGPSRREVSLAVWNLAAAALGILAGASLFCFLAR